MLSLGTNGRLQSSGTTASTYLHWCVLHKNKVPDAAAVTVRLRCTLLTPKREPRKMGKGVLGTPFSLSPSNHWKFVIGDTKNVVGYTETPQSGQMVRAGLLLFSPVLTCCIFEVHVIVLPILYSFANVIWKWVKMKQLQFC